ncbi:MAG TPA: hypothetical protein VNT75_00880 [Symbiobacteriaceae bacterium]|nr:hypothetical protein [Symbiobacteriaceae bacterium]
MSADKPAVQFDAFLEDLVPDLDHVPAYRVLIGLVGKGHEGKIRVYAWNLAHYTEVDEKKVLYARRLPFVEIGSILFVKADEQPQVNAMQHGFLMGQMTQATQQVGTIFPTIPCPPPTTPLTHCPTSGTSLPFVCCPLRGDQANVTTNQGAAGTPMMPTWPLTHCPTTPPLCPPTVWINCPTANPIHCPPTLHGINCPPQGNQANATGNQLAGIPSIPVVDCAPPTTPPKHCPTSGTTVPFICC